MVQSSLPTAVAALLERPVAIFGAGVSGAGVQTLLASVGAEGSIYDERADGPTRAFSSRDAARHGLVVYSPGFPPEHRWLMTALDAGCVCLGELDFASLFWKGEIIAITGTNGKTTLTEFLAHALNSIGTRAHATGNVGYPFSRLVVEHPDDVVAVCEVSSFQAETLMHLRPTATLWTNFAEDHLERHPDLNAYFAAKWRLVERTPSGGVLAGPSVQRFCRLSRRTLRSTALVETENLPADPELAGTVFATYPQRENFVLAAAWWERRELPLPALYAAARSFRAGPHRLARVAEKDGVTYWNDSKATNFHAVEAALATFDAPVLWIGGGKAKGGDLAGFIRRIAHHLRHAYLIGETKPLLAAFCQSNGVPATTCATLAEAVAAARSAARKGDQVLLSPGFASFDMFRGYDDRGKQFETLVENL
ncbi:MAG TPA: UDP-N-acetylmuramoyl-L-alanine--D-glutamate ligase [Candidatus Didemnitutus sp.]|nr:UDP-N-acetylmuramoyl-L-alanine--D-glutamate ligase [Candidatus Didemnitutus sp.]